MVLPIVWTNVYAGIRSVDPDLLEMARVFRFGKIKTLKLIYVPSMAPSISSALITGLSFAWKAGVSAEVLSHPVFSIGTRIYESKLYLETEDLFAWTVVIVILSLLLEKAAVSLLKKYTWRVKIGKRGPA
jgi:NitT/TauT family transport system permease protein